MIIRLKIKDHYYKRVKLIIIIIIIKLLKLTKLIDHKLELMLLIEYKN